MANTASGSGSTPSAPTAERHRVLTGFWYWLAVSFSVIGLALAIHYIFQIRIFGFLIYERTYHYLLLGFFLSLTFLFFPIKKHATGRKYFIFDVFLFLLTIGICGYIASQAFQIYYRGWGFAAPLHLTIMAIILWALAMEALRRTTGLTLVAVVGFFSLYPLFAEHMPGLLQGPQRPFMFLAAFHVLSTDSMAGMLIRILGDSFIGFLIFGAALQATGGGNFFLNIATALLGHTRGGPAKVAVMSSALFGSINGSAMANVVSTGCMTIPAMKSRGFPPHVAGAVEACASTGGVLVPPIMGAVAFVMAAFMGVSYYQIVAAAIVPSVLYYFSLYLQIDGFAVKHNLTGLSRDSVPRFSETLKSGWFYIISIVIMVYFLMIARIVGQAPFFGIAALFLAAMLGKKTRLSGRDIIQFFANCGKFMAEMTGMIAAIGLLLGAFSITGIGSSFARELIALAGGNVVMMLALGALASFVLGMGMTIIACYVFLAIIMVPALVQAGLNPMAVNLFVMYWAMLSCITPPVAIAAYAAAPLADASAMRIAWHATRMAGPLYIIPFLFALNPALIMQGDPGNIIFSILFTVGGIFIMASVLGGYFLGIGPMPGGIVKYPLGISLVVAGVLMGLPGWERSVIGLGIAAVLLGIIFIRNRRRAVLEASHVT